MSEIEIIKICWEGPFNINEITKGEIDKKYDVKSNDIGLYQIYGSHPLYGDSVLVYIGRTKNKNGFKSRLKDRWVIENGNDAENVQIYLGTIFSDHKKYSDEIVNDMIEKAEVLLINALKPAFNSSNIQSAKNELLEQKFIVHNEGNYRKLHPVLDSQYFWGTYKNFSIVDILAGNDNLKVGEVENEDEYYGFDLQDNDNIFVGIDYEYWNRKKTPLVIGVYKENFNDATLAKFKALSDNYGEDEEKKYYYIPAYEDLSNPNSIEHIKQNIEEVLSLLRE